MSAFANRPHIMTKKLPKIDKIMKSLKKNEAMLEDRREYDADMLASMYSLTPDEAIELHGRIRVIFTAD